MRDIGLMVVLAAFATPVKAATDRPSAIDLRERLFSIQETALLARQGADSSQVFQDLLRLLRESSQDQLTKARALEIFEFLSESGASFPAATGALGVELMIVDTVDWTGSNSKPERRLTLVSEGLRARPAAEIHMTGVTGGVFSHSGDVQWTALAPPEGGVLELSLREGANVLTQPLILRRAREEGVPRAPQIRWVSKTELEISHGTRDFEELTLVLEGTQKPVWSIRQAHTTRHRINLDRLSEADRQGLVLYASNSRRDRIGSVTLEHLFRRKLALSASPRAGESF